MPEATVLVLLCKPRAIWNEVGLYLFWKWVMCQYVLCCWLRQCCALAVVWW